jgi:hypothetical protein
VINSLEEFNSQTSKKTFTQNSISAVDINPHLAFMKLFNENPMRNYKEHTEDIIDICWGIQTVKLL